MATSSPDTILPDTSWQQAFVETQAGWYLSPDVRNTPGLVWSDLIGDKYWNFLTGLTDAGPALDSGEQRLRELGREPAVYLTDEQVRVLDGPLRSRGYTLTDREVFLVATAVPGPVIPPELDVRVVETDSHIDDLVEVFTAAHSTDADALYGELDPVYAEALRRSVGRPQTTHFVGYVDERPVAIGSTSTWRGLTGLYNGATRPEFRRRGYGTALMRHRATAAFASGARAVFLQTVAGESVDRRYQGDGFSAAFVGHLYSTAE